MHVQSGKKQESHQIYLTDPVLTMQLHYALGFSQQTAADLLGLHFLPGQTLWKFLGVCIFQGIITDY